MPEPKLFEDEFEEDEIDPEETPLRDRKLIVQPYDSIIKSLIDQIESGTIHLRPLSEKPRFQRRYVWSDKLASRLIESILLNVPISPIYLSQNKNMELDVIDGQQRVFSLYRFWDNQFKLSSLEVLIELNGKQFFQLDKILQLKLVNHSLRCVVITNESHPEIKFEVFQRLNTNTVPLNAQELRNCVYRGLFNDLLGDLASYDPWLKIIGRSRPDRRMRDEELILRFFAFHLLKLETYRTPLKYWLNDAADGGKQFNEEEIEELRQVWTSTIDKCLQLFDAKKCFRRPTEDDSKRVVINRALMDLTMQELQSTDVPTIRKRNKAFLKAYSQICGNKEFEDLISRAVDHKSRVEKRFQLWSEIVSPVFQN